MEELIYVDRRNSNCNKWDGQTAMFGEEGLHAMWVADMDFKIPQCVQKALHEYVDFWSNRILPDSRWLLRCIYQLGKETF